jgi:hypothetical protein
MNVTCPFCKASLPFRQDKRGGRYFRCNGCQTASFFSGKPVIHSLDQGGTWSFTIQKESGHLNELFDELAKRRK